MSNETEWKVERPDWWPDGPWMTEPDKVNWKTKAGLPGMIVRSKSGHLCGYVAVAKGHPCYGRDFTSDHERNEDGDPDYDRPIANPVHDLRVHGGITYAAACAGAICHVPEPGEPDDVWWLGFDCIHSGDWNPSAMAPYLRDRRMPGEAPWPELYRDISYVTGEVETLAEQLATMTNRVPPHPTRTGER
jgi:hypothetical protein